MILSTDFTGFLQMPFLIRLYQNINFEVEKHEYAKTIIVTEWLEK